MPHYTILIGVDDGPDRYQELSELVEAPDPRSAAQLVIDRGIIHPDDQFPQILVLEERQVGLFTRDDHGRAATDEEDFGRLLEQGPATVGVGERPVVDGANRAVPLRPAARETAPRRAAARRGSPTR